MDQNKASQLREVVIKNPLTNISHTYSGDEVYSITSNGIVIAVKTLRILYPWHNVESFTYHAQDVAARKAIQGW